MSTDSELDRLNSQTILTPMSKAAVPGTVRRPVETSDRSRPQMGKLVYELYGLTDKEIRTVEGALL